MTGPSFAWWIFCNLIAFAGGAWLRSVLHHCPARPKPTDRVSVYARCGCVRWQVIGRRVPFRAPCPAHMVLDEMHRIVDDEQQRLLPGKGHWS